MKYIRRLRLQLTWWKTVKSEYGVRDYEVLYRPSPSQIIGTVFEKHFYQWKNNSNPCSCSLCRDEKYKRSKHGKNGYMFEIKKIIEDEGCGDRFQGV